MAADDPLCNEPLLSVEFEVFGKVQGVYFPKYVRDICLQLGICGWVKNSKRGTILGKMQGPRALVDQIHDKKASVDPARWICLVVTGQLIDFNDPTSIQPLKISELGLIRR